MNVQPVNVLKLYKKKNATPECCGKPMKQLPLEICLQPNHAEHARTMDRDEPCDDFRAG